MTPIYRQLLTLDITEKHPLYKTIISEYNKWRKFKENLLIFFYLINIVKVWSSVLYTHSEFFLKLLFIKIVYNIAEEELIKHSKANMAYKLFSGLNWKITFSNLQLY